MFGGWQGIMSRKRPYTGIDWSGYTPQMNTPMADPGLVAGNARVASGTTIPQTSTAGKKGLSMKNMIKALTEMKKPPDQAKAGVWKGGEARPQLPAPPQFAALGGVNPSIMNVGGLGDEANKRWRKIMGYS